MKNYLEETKIYHDKLYKKLKYSFQRKFPNEDVIRFANQYLKESSNILDIGSGTGRNAIFLINQNHKVDCLDFSDVALNLLKKIYKKKNISNSNKVINDNIPTMNKISSKYDAVIDCFTSYSLILEDFKSYIKNVSLKLKKGGVFHLQILSKNSDLFKKSYPAKIILKNSINRIKRKSAPFYGDKYLFTFYNKKEILKILQRIFKKIHIEIHSRTYRNGKEYFEYFILNCKK